MATRTLMELIAVDQPALFASLLPRLAPQKHLLGSPRLLERMASGGRILWQTFGDELWSQSDAWASDVARGWAAMAVGCVPALQLRSRLRLARKFAIDPHWSVREWAWLGVRDHIVDAPLSALRHLTPWANSRSPYVRRFASESTRPIGVWSKHIRAFRVDPSPALPLLSELCDDPSRYVRLSVGNWLNDASKTNPNWVASVCLGWPNTPSCDHIRRRAMRTMKRLQP
jgi:3-methyladenine DNA glycosylase AlkC